MEMSASDVPFRDRVVGCVLGGAVGDALGAPFEGLWARSIPRGSDLFAGYAEFEGYPRGQFTDDTQLTVATLRSIVRRGGIDPADIARSIAALFEARAVIGPGGACRLAAAQFVEHGDWTRCGAPEGEAGNGTAMRTAALGLYFGDHAADLPRVVADASRITHHDARSIAGGVAIAKACALLASGRALSPAELLDGVADTCEAFHAPFAEAIRDLGRHTDADTPEALDFIAWSGMRSPEFDEPIITPFVIPTVLAALWCVVREGGSWEGAVARAIGLGGDVDTLGAIVGALMGARLGIASIPAHLVESVVDARVLTHLAERYLAAILMHRGSV